MAVRKTLIDGFTVEYDKKQSLKDAFRDAAPYSKKGDNVYYGS